MLYGKQKQIHLKQKTVVVLGVGGIGNPLLTYLVSSGVGNIHIFEFDYVESSNLARQVLYSSKDVGELKSQTALKKLKKINPYVNIYLHKKPFQQQDNLPHSDFILEGTDSVESKFHINRVSIRKKIPALIAGIGALQGHIFPVLSYKKSYACYSCIFGELSLELIPTCSDTGVLSSLPGIIGTMMAHLVLLYFFEGTLEDRLYLIEKFQWRNISIKKNNSCSCLAVQ